MTRDVQTVDPNTTVKETAEKMKELDIGSLPVCQGHRVVGMITDRDITLRVTAEGKDPEETRVGDVMSLSVITCTEDQDLEEAERIMHNEQVRRLPVVDLDGDLVGFISMAKLARAADEKAAGRVLKGVSQPEKPAPATSVARGGNGKARTGRTKRGRGRRRAS